MVSSWVFGLLLNYILLTPTHMLLNGIFFTQWCPCLYDNVDVKQTMLETIVPKSDSEDIMVVLGEHRGQVSGWVGWLIIIILPVKYPCWFLFHSFHYWLDWRSTKCWIFKCALLMTWCVSGRSYPPEGPRQEQSHGAAGQIWGESLHPGLWLHLPLRRRRRSLIPSAFTIYLVM